MWSFSRVGESLERPSLKTFGEPQVGKNIILDILLVVHPFGNGCKEKAQYLYTCCGAIPFWEWHCSFNSRQNKFYYLRISTHIIYTPTHENTLQPLVIGMHQLGDGCGRFISWEV